MKKVFALVASVLILAKCSFAENVYLALGDSVAFGFQPIEPYTTTPSYGDYGYVRPFADFLGQFEGTPRPKVANLALVTETSSSFFDLTNIYRLSNLNYGGQDISQRDLMVSTVQAELLAGNVISTASFALGANDFLDLLTPEFFNLTFGEQQALFLATLGAIDANYTNALTTLRGLLPNARLMLPGYYNPYGILDPGDPYRQYSDIAISVLNSTIESKAAIFGGTYVDFFTPIRDHEAEFTWMTVNDIHPTDAGYAVLAESMANAVPEPSTVLVLAGALAFLRRRVR